MPAISVQKIILPVLAVSLSGSLLALWGAWHVRTLQQQSAAVLKDSIHAARVTEQLDFQIQDLRHRLSPDFWRETMADPAASAAMRTRIEDWLRQADQAASTTEERNDLQRVHRGLDILDRRLEEASRMTDPDLLEHHFDSITEQTLDLEVLQPAQNLLDRVQTRLEEAHDENLWQSRRLVRALLGLALVGGIAGVAAGFAIARTVRQSILQLSIPIQDVAGKLNEVVGPLKLSTDLRLEELAPVLQRVSKEVSNVVEKLHDSHREVARAEQLAALGQLAAGMAHEIRNPLMCIKTLVQVAASSPDATLDRRDLQVLDQEINRLEELLREFLDFAHPGRFVKTLVEFRQVVDSTVSFLQARAEQRHITLVCEVNRQPVIIEADSNRLRQAVLNLLLNALDASPAGGEIRVQLRHASDEQPARRCELRISDAGAGVPEHLRDRIFEPFYSTKETGLGLGLPICRRVIEAHQGQIAVRPSAAGGAEFLVTLPLAEVSDSSVTNPSRHSLVEG